MKVFKKILIAMIIVLTIFVLFVVSFICYTTSFFSSNSYYKWIDKVKNIAVLENSVILKSDDKLGKVTMGSSDNQDYGIYWIIESENNFDQLKSYYQYFVDKINIDYSGYPTCLYIDKVPNSNPFWFEDLDGYMKDFKKENYSKSVYIVYIYKPGRQWLKN